MFLAKHVVNTTKFTVSMIGTNWRAQFGLHVGVRFELPGPAKFPSDQKKFQFLTKPVVNTTTIYSSTQQIL